MKVAHKLKQFPVFQTDEEAERFVDEADLSEYDFSDMVPLAEFEARRKAGRPALGEKAKQHVSLRLDPEVISKFKMTGKGWQGRINDALRAAAPATKAPRSPYAPAAMKVAAKAAPAKKAASVPAAKAAAKPAVRKFAPGTKAPAAKAAAKPAARTTAAKPGHRQPASMQRRKG